MHTHACIYVCVCVCTFINLLIMSMFACTNNKKFYFVDISKELI